MTRSSRFPRWIVDLWDVTALLLLNAWDRIVRLVPWPSGKPPKSPSFVRSTRTSYLLNVRPVRQLTSFSCTAGCLQSLHLYLTGQRLSHLKAIELLRCKPHGAPLQRIALIIKRRVRCRSRILKSAGQLRKALKRGNPVIASDEVSYDDGHAILVTGFTAQGFWTIDPAVGRLRWRTSKRLLATSDEFIVVER